ncbi:Protein of unknown function, partial [Gryllus bimaculatus]
MAWGWT